MDQKIATNNVRVRIAHSKTQRDGWGYETTVELTMDHLGPEEAEAQLQIWLQYVDRVARAERDRRADLEALGMA